MLPPSLLKSSLSATKLTHLLRLAFAICLLSAVLLNKIVSHDDPHRCKALLHEGSWLHEPNGNGARQPFTNWQPDGCMLRQYSKEEIQRCLGGRDVVISGDSTTRQIYWAFARLLDRERAIAGEAEKIPHHDDEATYGDVHLIQYWDPYMETDDDDVDLEFQINPGLMTQLNLFQHEKHHHIPAEERQGPAFIILSAGAWFAFTKPTHESLATFKLAIDKLTNILKLENTTDFGTDNMHPIDGLGPDVFFAPTAPPFYDELPDYKTSGDGIARGEVEAIDDYLYEIEAERNLRLVKSFPQLSFNQPEAIVDRGGTGFHVIDSVAEVKATILLNLRCNAMLDAQDGFPYNRTCCTDYGPLPFVQTVLIGAIMLYVLACLVFEVAEIYTKSGKPQTPLLGMEGGIFGASLLFCYFADRTQLFAKGNKEFVLSELRTLIIIGAVFGLISLRKVQLRQSAKIAPVSPTNFAPADITILSRDQTDEWKGWSQCIILFYHWTGASSHLPTYIFVRLLIASYLFQIGFGHTVYFLEKRDFSFRRVATVLLRLNLLSCALPYIMNTNYMFYYFAPLASFWFLVVYSILAWKSSQNGNTNHILGKIGIFCIITLLLQFVPIWNWVFSILQAVFNIHWDLHDWVFRVNLDGLIVFVGMLSGVAYQRLERNKTWYTKYHTIVGASIVVVAMIVYYTSLTYLPTKQDYNRFHPYISFLPIISFVLLRNATAPLRTHFSAAAAWLGRCSLETYILQYHIFLAADTKGVLLLDIFRGGDGSLLSDRWRDLAVIVPVFLWLSHSVSEATSTIVKILTTAGESSSIDLRYDGTKSELDDYGPVSINEQESNVPEIHKTSRFMYFPDAGVHTYLAAFFGGLWLLNWLY